MVVVCSLWRWSEIWVESAYLFIEIKAGPAVASKFVRQFLSNLVSTRPCHCFLVVAGGLVTKTKGCGICSFGGHETLENMVCHSCGDPVSFLSRCGSNFWFRLQTMHTSLGCCYLRNATWKMEKANRIQSKFIQKLHVSTDTSGNQIALLHNFGWNRFSPRAMKVMKRADIGWQVMTLSSIVTIETQVPSKTLYRPLANCWALCSRSARHFLFVDLERILLWC